MQAPYPELEELVIAEAEGQALELHLQHDGPRAAQQGPETAPALPAPHHLARATAGAAEPQGLRLDDEDDLAALILGSNRAMALQAPGVVEKARGHAPVSLC